MEKWKLFNSEKHGQILVTRGECDEGNPRVAFSVEIEGFDEITMGPTFSGENSEEVRDKIFSGLNLEVADNAVDGLISELKIQKVHELLSMSIST